ncbi:MAG: Cof-type HAD-IIB family hydrolase [Propioniciclava sp.]
MPHLIATDLDGTLLRSDHTTISPRNRAALTAAAGQGVRVVAISGRQPYSIAAIVAGTPLEGVALGSNGAIGVDLATGEPLFQELIDVEVQSTFTRAMQQRFGNVKVTSVRDYGNTYVAQHGYDGDKDPGAGLAAWPVAHRYADLRAVLEVPSVKLVLRDPDLDPVVLWEAARELDLPGCEVTTSGAPFLEVGPAGVTKATGLARLCTAWGINADDVVALGDHVNDVEMLAWAGHGVAMGNAELAARQVADEVTGTNEDDGFAQAVERLLAAAPSSGRALR